LETNNILLIAMEEELKIKRCACCGETLPTTMFYRSKLNKDGLHSYCKKCMCAKTKAYYNARAEQRKAIPPIFDFDDQRQPREVIDTMKRCRRWLIERGYNCEVQLSYLQEIKFD
jgi:hypothetical protein